MSQTTTKEQTDVVTLAADTMVGDLRDFILDRMRHEHHALPWSMRPEAEQKEVINRVTEAVRANVHKAISILAADGRKCLPGVLVKVLVKDGLKAQIDMLMTDPLRHQLIDHQGRTVLVSVIDPDQYDDERSPVKISKDQPEMFDGDDREEVE